MILLLLIILDILAVLVLAGLLVIFGSNLFSSWLGAPYVPIGRQYIKAVLLWGGLQSSDVFCDLGSGDGRVLRVAVSEFGVGRAIGYERSLWPYWKASWLVKRAKLQGRITLRRQDFLLADLTGVSFIYLYLFPKVVDRLAHKFSKEIESEVKILSLDFPINLQKHPTLRLLKTAKIGRMTAYLYER